MLALMGKVGLVRNLRFPDAEAIAKARRPTRARAEAA